MSEKKTAIKKKVAKRRNFVGIYKPRNNIKGGAAAQFKIAAQRSCMFLETAPQVRPKNDSSPYDWENGINVKLGHNDIGSLLAFFNGNLPLNNNPKEPDLQLFHKFENSTTIIKIKKQNLRYFMNITKKKNGELRSVSIPIEQNEVELIKIALSKGFSIILGW